MRIVSCNKPVILSLVYKSLHSRNISETVCCSISCKPVSALISSEPVKSFVMCKPICFSNVSIAKNFNSVNYCSVTCTKNSVSAIASAVSYRAACPVDFAIVVQTVNVTLSCTDCCVSIEIRHRIAPTFIFILELSLHSAISPATLQFAHHHIQPHH